MTFVYKGREAEYMREYRAADPSRQRGYYARYYASGRRLLDELKAVPCMDCGGNFPPECMDFDHVRGTKAFGIGRAVAASAAVIMAEIEKCEVVCANCHRLRTKSRRDAKKAVAA